MVTVAGAESIRPEHPRPRQLSELALKLGLTGAKVINIEVSGVAASSSEVHAGDVFFALPGARYHGAKYAESAIQSGAVGIVTDAAGAALIADFGVPVLVVDEPRLLLGAVSAWIYHTDNTTPELYGVTGTNGKTTVVYLVAALLEQMGWSAGLSSTAERRIGTETFESGLTTPESNHLHALIARMNESDVRAAAIEVSAHALTRHRVDGLTFDVVGYTNFSHDHLDDYGTLEEYFAAKTELFDPDRAHRGVVILDSHWGKKLVDGARIPVTTIGYEHGEDVDWSVSVTARSPISTGFTLTARDGRTLTTAVPMVGDYSALNAALAIVMLEEGGHNFDLIAHSLQVDGGFKVAIPGRTEIVSGEHGPLVYVDYGHTPGAFEHTLRAIRGVVPGKVIMVFGADGDRDVSKRTEMGAVAARGSDVVVITDYHPRTENPAEIRAALLDGARAASSGADIREVPDPREAVRVAISLAGEGDAILYAGPGHEDYRDVGSERIAYSAREDMRLALVEAGW
jgi:UDP-N-acetylmuramoyl-L-alanyl-D-glutamate--2,6-diaminopimelate ligase